MAEENNYLRSTKKLCRLHINKSSALPKNIKELTFVDVSKHKKKGSEESVYSNALVKEFPEIYQEKLFSQLEQDEVILLLRPSKNYGKIKKSWWSRLSLGSSSAKKIQGMSNEVAVFYNSELNQNQTKTAILCDLEKYMMCFRHSLDQTCIQFKQAKPPSHLITKVSNADRFTAEIIKCLLQGLQQQMESGFFRLASDQIAALRQGPGDSFNEISLYASGLLSMFLAISQESQGCMNYMLRNQALFNTNDQFLLIPAMMTLASKIAHDNRSQGSKIVSMTFVKQEKSEHLQQLLEQDKSINNGVSQEEMSELNKTDYEKEIVGDAQKEDGTSPNINCVSLTEVHLPESEPPRYVCNKKKLEFKNTFLKCLYLKFSTKPDSGILSGNKAFLAEEIAKISLGHIKSSLFSWEVIQYNNLSSNIIGPILLTILRHCKPSEGNGEDEAAAISEECLEIAKFFLMLYADELCEQIFNDVAAGGIDLIPDCSEKHSKSLQMPKDVIQGHITKKGMMEQVDMIEPQKYQSTESSQLRSPKSTNIQLPKSAETQLSEIPTNLSPKQHLVEELIVPDEEETAITIANEIEVAQAVEPVPSVSTECTGEPMDQGLMQASMYDLIKVLAHTILQGALMLSEPNTLTTIGSPSHSVSSDTCEACLDSKWYYSTISGAVAEYKGNNAFGLSKIIAKNIRPDCVRHLLEHMKPSHFGPHHQMWTSQVKTIHPVNSISEIKVTNLNICEDKYKKELQVILQWSVASELDVAEMFLVVNDEEILEKLEKLEMQVRTKKQCVGDLLQAVLNYHQEREKAELREELLDWLLNNM